MKIDLQSVIEAPSFFSSPTHIFVAPFTPLLIQCGFVDAREELRSHAFLYSSLFLFIPSFPLFRLLYTFLFPSYHFIFLPEL